MWKRWMVLAVCVKCMMATCAIAQTKADELKIDWTQRETVSRSTPTLQVVVNPQLMRGAALHDASFKALHELGADYVRYVPWLPYPRLAVPELGAPNGGKTFWDFTHIDPMMEDFIQATDGHSVILNFSTIPAWMFKTDKPVQYPDDPTKVFWDYTLGTELRDPSMREVSEYFARLLEWYERGGFTDEYGKRHESGHHYKIAYWEILNEIEAEHNWSPEVYTHFYDSVTAAMRKVDPQIHFMALALADPSHQPQMFEYFLNPAHHAAGAPLDFISYHFYATPRQGETSEVWQYTFFDQEQGFLNTVRYVEEIRKRLSPNTKTDLDELGAILPTDNRPSDDAPITSAYWNIASAMYADLYVQLAKLSIDVVGESQLVGYPTQYPSVSMMDYVKLQPNARFWTLKLIKEHFGPGDHLVKTEGESNDFTAQAFETAHGRCILLINKRLAPRVIKLPVDFKAAKIEYVAPSTGSDAPATRPIQGGTITLEANEVAVVTQ
jgi:hypothetical protein